MTTNEDQLPERLERRCCRLRRELRRFTGLYADAVLDLLGVGDGHRAARRRRRHRSDLAAGRGTGRRGGAVDRLRSRHGRARGATPARTGGHDRCSARVMDGQALDLPDDAVDAGVSMFGLMFFPDAGAGRRLSWRGVVRPAAGSASPPGTWRGSRCTD